MDNLPLNKDVVLFDGVCNFCNDSINFVIDHDPKSHFVFAPLQEQTAQAILKKYQLPTADFDTVMLLRKGKIYKKSSAALQIARKMSGAWPLLFIFWIIPPFIRDSVYDVVAKNRYKWFGKEEACRMPTPELRARFIR